MHSDNNKKPNFELEAWKSSLTFTGEDAVFPVEMFVALMEHKNKEHIRFDDSCIVKKVLNHVPDVINDTQNNSEHCSPAAIWKQTNINRLTTLDWKGLKDELFKEFGQSKRYNMKEKLNFLYSIRKGSEEDRQSYLIRISMIVCYIEHGQICDLAPSSIWVRLLYMVGISSGPSEFPFDNAKAQNANTKKIFDNTSNVISDIKFSEVIDKSDGAGSYSGDQDEVLDPHIYMRTSFSDNELDPNDDNFALHIDIKHELNDNDTESVTNEVVNNIYFNLSDEHENNEGSSKINYGQFSNLVEDTVKDKQFLTNDEVLNIGKKVFSCRICRKTFSLKDEEATHRLFAHSNQRQCKICFTPFKSIKERKAHRINFHQNGKICEICDLSFDCSKEMQNHQIQHHEGRQYKCKLCGSEMMYQAINQHVNTVHYDGRTSDVKVAQKKRKLYVSTLAKVPEGKDYRLSSNPTIGPLKYVMPGGLTPLKGKVNKLLHYCGICNKQMKSINDLRTHCNKEHEGKRFKCDNCSFTSKAPHELARHLLRVHHMETDGYEVFRCTYPNCDYKCIEKHKFQTHIDGVHKGLRTFKCNACDKSFGQKGTLKLHVQGVHMGLRKWKCDGCEKEFHQKTLLDLHKARIHGIGELPKHVCYVCGSVFTTKSNLGKHLSRSHGIFKRKEYKRPEVECPHCHKTYFKYLLQRHIRRMHQEFREYPCSSCDKEYPDKNELKRHILLDHLKARPFRCKLCGRKFKKGWDLNYHICATHEGQSTKEARNKCSSMGAAHPAFEKVSKEELDKLFPDFDIKDDIVTVPIVSPSIIYTEQTRDMTKAIQKF